MAQTTTRISTIGEVIRAWREFRGLSSTELAEKAGVRIGYLSEIEHNRTANPWEEYLVKLADALGVALQDIYGRRMPAEKRERQRLKRATGLMPSPEQPAATLPTIAHPSIDTDSLGITGEEIERLIASVGLSEEEEKRVAIKLIEITKHLLELIKPQHGE